MPGLIDTREPEIVVDREAEIGRLEELWEASPGSPAPPRRRPLAKLAPVLGPALAFGWVAFVVSIFFEPVPEPGAVAPGWADALVGGFWIVLVGAGILALTRSRVAYGAALGAGALGMTLAITCRTSAHHLGSWWIYELGATAALAGLAAIGLARSR